ncbi:hypothetical protein [Rhodococcus qingshengii]|uniref:hypothetical protein n=1 Tax=Rhodococcus qingshengii TaxID=334542 RepID=UPI001A55921F|nr:hypothetical protein [Rhodococcus qingshengii]ULD38836.1 hypothetical protein JKI97_00610 [Rhodococcus qingshengii]
MNYTLRGTKVCATHQVAPKAREADINCVVGQLGASDAPALLRAAVISAVAPTISATCTCGTVSQLTDSGDDADWIIRCAKCATVRACTEHKPKGAPQAWSPVDAAVYDDRSPQYRGTAPFETPGWFADLPDTCKTPHANSECNGWHPRVSYRRRSAKAESRMVALAAPQVFKYAFLHPGVPISVVNDSGLPISELYETASRRRRPDDVSFQFGFTLDDSRFPILGTNGVLMRLAASLDGIELSLEQEADVRAVVEAMAMRAGIVTDLDIDERWLRAEVRACARGEGCDVVAWGTFLADHCE